jgi:hypothetical protein
VVEIARRDKGLTYWDFESLQRSTAVVCRFSDVKVQREGRSETLQRPYLSPSYWYCTVESVDCGAGDASTTTYVRRSTSSVDEDLQYILIRLQNSCMMILII